MPMKMVALNAYGSGGSQHLTEKGGFKCLIEKVALNT